MAVTPHTRLSLNGNDWLFKDFVGEDWRWRHATEPDNPNQRGWRRGTVPGTVAHDLWMNGDIPDPYVERNTLLIEWIPARTWVYKRTFLVGEEYRGQSIRLNFEGVDYDAEFFLNGESLGRHQGMYTPARFDVGDRLKYGEDNLIAVVIEPAPHEQPQIGRTTRVRTHKSRMGYWWDFCPRMVHVGIWDGVSLDITGPARIDDVFARPVLSDDLTRTVVTVSTAISCTQPVAVEVETVIRFDQQEIARQRSTRSLTPGHTVVDAILIVPDPRLWWPNGYGDPSLYTAEVRALGADGSESDHRAVTFGIRRIGFTRNETSDETALPYVLNVNGQRIYIQGWNWVPLDVMYGVERPAKLENLLTLAQRAHVNFLRVWGGGLIEKEGFYDACDRRGILVWQEFIQSSSGIDNSPSDDPQHIEMMVHEAEQIIPRKRNHASLALWCGGNELMDAQGKPLDDHHPMLAALHDTVRRLDPDRTWLPTSPTGPVFSNSQETIEADPRSLHDVHGPWEHLGLTEQYTLYNRGTSLFHSEFGAEGITNLRTLKKTIAEPHRWPVSLDNAVWVHLGAWWVKTPQWEQSLGKVEDLDTLVQATQYLQAEAVRYAVESDRRRQYQNSGTMPWQFNEPYPMAACTSAVDYYGYPKPLYYAVSRAYEPLHVSARFASQVWEGQAEFEAEIWVSNAYREPLERATLTARLVGASGRVYTEQSSAVSVPGDGSMRLADFGCPLEAVDDVFYLDLRLQTAGINRSINCYLFTRTGSLAPVLRLPKTALSVERDGDTSVTIANRGDQVALFVWIASPGAGYVYLSDNHLCLGPGERRTIETDWSHVPGGERQLVIKGWNTDAVVA